MNSNKKCGVLISPSLICANLLNLRDSFMELESLGITSIHVDILDGHFSPSMPLGLETVRQLRKVSNLDFDCHIMTTDNEFFIKELLHIGVQSICFHYESAFHVERMMGLIREGGAKPGIALNPATPLSVLDYMLDSCDYVLPMLISPGYAGSKDETMVSYAFQKVRDLRQLIDDHHLNTKIIVDGRVSIDVIPKLVACGADVLVAGSTSLFRPGFTAQQNYHEMLAGISQGLAKRNEVCSKGIT